MTRCNESPLRDVKRSCSCKFQSVFIDFKQVKDFNNVMRFGLRIINGVRSFVNANHPVFPRVVCICNEYNKVN